MRASSPTYKPPLGAFRCQWSGELRRWVVRVAVTGLEPGMSDEFKRAEIGDINQHQAGENFAGVPPHASSISGINTNRAGQAHAVLSSAVDGLP